MENKLYIIINQNDFSCGGTTEKEPNHSFWTLIPYMGGFTKEKFDFDSNEWVESADEESIIKNRIDIETERYIKRTQDGIQAYAKISAEFRLAKLSGQISEQTHKYIEEILIPVRNEVLAGQWISSLNKLEEIGENLIG